MAKSLGQIHTVSKTLQNTAAGDLGLLDLSGELASQLQRRVHMMSTFKVCGFDIAVSSTGDSTVSGELRYFAPTKGRVEALKKAWEAAKDMFKLNGIEYWNNLNYDFRPIMRDPTVYDLDNVEGTDFVNQASLESVGGVPGPLTLITPPAGYKSVFATYNENILPQSLTPTFSTGFNVIESGTAGDLVLNEGEILSSRVPIASEELESIPFQVSTDTSNNDASPAWQWRPDPALYLAVLTGQVEIFINMSSNPNTDLDISVMVAGWKGVMGSHRRTKSMKKNTSKRKTHGSKRRHSKR